MNDRLRGLREPSMTGTLGGLIWLQAIAYELSFLVSTALLKFPIIPTQQIIR